jgi:ferric-dicitrate binding protein FerR (iron transport regulator)
MTPQELLLLADKVATGVATDQEIVTYYHAINGLHAQEGWNEQQMGDRSVTGAAIQQRIWKKMDGPVVWQLKVWRYAAAAAVLLVIAGTGIWITNQKKTAKTELAHHGATFQTSIGPGSNKATLTLSDGSTVLLDSTQKGVITDQSGVQIINAGNAQLFYKSGIRRQPSDVSYNILTTPRGGQYHITLPDGSRVWLNAASSIRYPVVFTGKERRVEMSGEAYFEVVANAAMPFKVHTASQQVEVLGTSFNLNAYDDEAHTQTTLVEGSVRIVNQASVNQASVILKPSEQASLSRHAAGAITVSAANVDATVAWKNGLFEFKDADIQTIMRQLSRWYEVEVKYKPGAKGRRLTGKIQRTARLAEVLEMLSYAGLDLSVNGNTIEVGN